jgi:hypothetical protein
MQVSVSASLWSLELLDSMMISSFETFNSSLTVQM